MSDDRHIHTNDADEDEFDRIVEMVDQPSYDAPTWLRSRVLSEQRLPILPAWARSWDEFRKATSWVWRHTLHVAEYHAVRVPVYVGRALLRLPVGVWRLTGIITSWTRDSEVRHRLALMHEDPENHEYVRLTEIHHDHLRHRAMLVAALVAAAVWFAVWVFPTLDVGLQALIIASVTAGLSKLGEARDDPIISRAVVPHRVERLTADMVERALWELHKIKAGDPIRFPGPIQRDGGGWRAEVDLPSSVTAADVIEQRDKLAAALRRPLGCVWPEPAPEVHPGRLVLWVGDQDMADAKPARWPLARKGTVNLFGPVPFGTDQRGRPITVTLMYASMVIGAIPRMGKTVAVRLLLLAAALDPRAELHVYDLKGTGDFRPLEPVAHRYRAGDDIDDIAYALADLRKLAAEFRRRAKVIADLPPHVCPASKVTDDLASRAGLRLHPIVVAIDECQLWYQHPEDGGEFERLVSDLAKRGPAVGICVINATQEPNAKTLPTSISRNAALRFCLKVTDQISNDAVLGTSAYKAGVRATLLKRNDLGIGWLAGEGDEPTVVRTYYVDAPAAEPIVERARLLRGEAGTLPDGDDLQMDDTARLLSDILAVIPAGEEKAWSETVCDRLADYRPGLYEGWGPEQLATALKPYGVDTVQIHRRQPDGSSTNRRGIVRGDVVAAYRARQNE